MIATIAVDGYITAQITGQNPDWNVKNEVIFQGDEK